jgi:SAM-dependent methyltransferase
MLPGAEAYAFAKDDDRERARMADVERSFDPVTWAALLEVGVGAGWRCWEVGAGRGSIAHRLAEAVGEQGALLASDLDERWFSGGRGNLAFLRHHVTVDPPPARDLDLVHARFLLEHLADPRPALVRMIEALRPGGVVVIEDAAGLRFEASGSSAFDRICPAWERAARAAGWSPRYGERLVDDLRACGLAGVTARRHALIATGGDAWRHARAGLARLRAELLAEGVAEQDLDEADRLLGDPAVVITGAPVITALGWRR